MEAGLEELLGDRSVLKAWLASLGITSCSDIRWCCADANACMCELESCAGAGVSREDILYMQDLYLMCAARANLGQRQAVRQIVAARDPTRRDVVSWKPAVPVPPAKRAKVLIPWRQTAQVGLTVVQDVALPVWTPLVQKKLRELLKLAADHFIAFEALGMPPVTWDDESNFVAAESLIMSSAGRCSSGHLSEVASCLRRWIKAANEQGCSLANPSLAQLAVFLKKVSFGGPTAAGL